jgi:transcription termination factor Rho
MKNPYSRGIVGKKKTPRTPYSPQQSHRNGPPRPRRRPAPPPHAAPPPNYTQDVDETPPPPAPDAVLTPVEGVLELHPRGFGFLRSPARSYIAQPGDAYVPEAFIRKFRLSEGVALSGVADTGRKGPGGPRLVRLDRIEGGDPEQFKPRRFDDLTPIDPREHIRLETDREPLTTRIMDMLTPIGKGQRGLIVAPPRSGKTILLQHIAQAVVRNHPEMHLILLLVDERPEEVTEFRRLVQGMGHGEVIASCNDHDSVQHARIAELVVERAKRMAEQGRQVFVLLDSLTRLARAYNRNAGNSGRTMSGGIDARALEIPKRLFGAARAFEEGGSVTVLGTCLIETGSRMDDIIFQEFKGTGNMELVLDRKLAERRIYPALDIAASGTRKEERLLTPETLQRVTLLRRGLVNLHPIQAMEGMVKKLGETASNAVFLEKVAQYIRA